MYSFSDISSTALRLDLPSALGLGFVEIVFVFFFIDVFDNVGTLVAVGKKAGLFDEADRIPRVNRILLSDASATIAGSLAGTSTVVNYIESAAGVVAGGRSGVTSIVTGLLFLVAMFVAPVFGVIRLGGDGAGADHCRLPDDFAHQRDRLGRPRGRRAGVPDHDYHPVEFQHRQRDRVRLHQLHVAQGPSGRVPQGKLAGVRADRAVYRPLCLPRSAMKPERLRTAAFALVLFLLNLWLVRGLLSIEYLDEMGSIEGSFLAIARWAKANWGDLTWYPLWFGGIPYVYTYPPLLHRIVAAVSALSGMSIAHAYHVTTAVFYSLGPVTLFGLALRLGGSRVCGFAAGLLYSLVSTSTFLIPAVRQDAGGMWGLRRFQAMAQYGEGPHIAAMTLLPLAVLLLDVAFERKRAGWWFAACLGVASVALTNWLGAAALAMAVLAWLLARPDKHWLGTWLTAAAIGAAAYLIASPGIPPSAIRTVAHNERFVSGVLPAASRRLGLAGCGLLAALFARWAFRRLQTPNHVRFSLLFLLPTAIDLPGLGMVPLLLRPSTQPLSPRNGDGARTGSGVLGAAVLGRLALRPRVAISCLLVAASVYGVVKCSKSAGRRIRPIQIENTIEHRVAQWFDRNMNGRRVFAPGSVGFFLNVFNDTPQFAGGVDQAVVNPLWTALQYQILTGDNAGEREGEFAVLWLKAFGVDAVAVSGPNSRESFKPFRNPRKFDGLLAELWRDGDDVIYRVPRRSSSLAHVIRPDGLAPRPPEEGSISIQFGPTWLPSKIPRYRSRR